MPRIIAGRLGGRSVPGPSGKGTRPTSDRVREALFSRLEGWDALEGARVLDLFAGTGALAFESLSRGATSAVLVEKHAPMARSLRSTAADLGLAEVCDIRSARAESVIEQLRHEATQHAGPFGLVFLDPPYDMETGDLEQLLGTLCPVLAEEALVVVERSRRSADVAWPEGWTDDGTKEYGDTVLRFGGPA